MYSFSYNPVDKTDTPDDIAFHNMKVADDTLNLELFIAGSFGWIKCNPDKSFQDLEKELRKRNFNTHLIALQPRLKNDMCTLGFPSRPDDKTVYDYECIFSCRLKEDAMQELLSISSYEENFEKLKRAACVIAKSVEILEGNDDIKILKDDEKTIMEKISDNEIKCYYKYETADQVIAKIMFKARNEYKKQPHLSVYEFTQSGPIYVVTIDKKIVSNIGILHDNNSKEPKLVYI